ncbi:hypothetical protein [Nakamurella sp. PAMC28650]|uniref:hypothetical protein n=1 Tax=Nakamurella sp. PAMC28650 TaxID=2762325 RepID=UPI00164CEBD2|nr:hypothetical protein [Nakamurella sp. PAMC28650]QNK81845.1 hypothetical protein H7F38_03325 [Nakamurella sp. PAMC28650]
MAEVHEEAVAGTGGARGNGPTGEVTTASSWPAGWPRLYPERAADVYRARGSAKVSRRVNFVGGSADGLWDLVEETAPGRLPFDVETMGSVYRLFEATGGDPRYHWHRFEEN